MKYALLIGINYTGTESELRGCINDVLNMKSILISKYGFLEENIDMLTDDTTQKPTAQNIIDFMSNVILKTLAHPNSEIWIHYSGHGSTIVDTSGDENDGFDEVLVPIDYATVGVITDDQLHHMFKYLPIQASCVCFFDCCHSGTLLDLKYKYKLDGTELIDNTNSVVKSNLILISGCQDCQTSADFCNMFNVWGGAMTTGLLNTLESHNYIITCHNLLVGINEYLRSNNKFEQIPQLTSSKHLTNDTVFSSVLSIPSFITKK